MHGGILVGDGESCSVILLERWVFRPSIFVDGIQGIQG